MDAVYLTSGQVARQLGVSNRTLRRAMQRGEIVPAGRTPGGWVRFLSSEVDAYADKLASYRHLAAAGRDKPGAQGTDAEDPVVRYRLIAELTADFAYSFTVLPDGTRVLAWISDAYERVTGYTLEDMRAKHVQYNLIYKDDLPIVVERTRTLLAGRPATCEYRIVTKRGEVRWVRDHARPVWDHAQGRVVRIDGTSQDITAAKHAEEQIHFQARLLDTVEQAVIATDMSGTITYWNRFAEVLFGWPATEVLGRKASTITPAAASGEQAAAIVARLHAGESWSGEFCLQRRDGSIFPAWVSDAPITDERGTLIGIVGICFDITERKRAEQAAEQARAVAEELAQLRQQQAEEAAAMVKVSAALSSTLEPAVLYELILDQVSRVLPYDHASVMLHEESWVTMAGSRGRVTVPVGTRVFRVTDITEVAAHGMAGKPALIPDTRDLATWLAVPPFTGEHRIRSVIVVPLMMENSVVGTFNVDSFTPNFYTERHLTTAMAFAERVAQALRNVRLYIVEQQRARAAEDLARLRSDFVGAVSHELRTPLTAIVGYAELLQAHWGQLDDAQRLERLDRIVISANRQQRLVEDLLLLTQVEQTRLEPRGGARTIQSLVQQATTEVQGVYSSQRIDLAGSGDLSVQADAARTVQILVNLLDNAAKYSPEGSPIAAVWGQEGEMVVVRVRDHGPGIPEHGRAQLFTRFGRVVGSRIRAGRVGTGLGLHLSRQLAQAMGGDLELQETGPDGSTFRLCLPAYPVARSAGERVR